MSEEKQKRLRAARQFGLQAGKLGYSIERWLTSYSCMVRDKDTGKLLRAGVLVPHL